MDLTKLSDADLEALQSGDLSKISDEALLMLQSTTPEETSTAAGAVAPTEEPGIGTMAVGGLKTAYDVVAPLVKEHPVATTLAASYVPGLNKLPILNDIKTTRQAAANIAKRGANLVSNVMNPAAASTNAAYAPGGPFANPTTTTAPSTVARTVPVTGSVAPANVPINTVPVSAPVANASTPTAVPTTQFNPVKGVMRGNAFVPATAETGMISRVAPYLQTAGRIAAPVARIAGPAGMAMAAYDAANYAQESGPGQRLAQGEGARGMQAFQNLNNRNVSGYMLSPTEAKNLLASGDERTINMYGGKERLQGIISAPNAVNSGYTNQLNNLSR